MALPLDPISGNGVTLWLKSESLTGGEVLRTSEDRIHLLSDLYKLILLLQDLVLLVFQGVRNVFGEEVWFQRIHHLCHS